MDFEQIILDAVSKIPRIKENNDNLKPNINDDILGGRLNMDSFDFAELIVILEDSTGLDPFSKISASRTVATTLQDLARLYEQTNSSIK